MGVRSILVKIPTGRPLICTIGFAPLIILRGVQFFKRGYYTGNEQLGVV